MEQKTDFGIRTRLTVPFDEALERTKMVLQQEGFGVLSEIDMKAKLKEKLDVDTGRYMILGACNPPLAYKALQVEKEIGLLLPCNVIVYEDGNATVVSAIDPHAMLAAAGGSAAISEVASDARTRLERAIAALRQPEGT